MSHSTVVILNILQGTGEHEKLTETQLHGVALSTVNDVVEDKWHSEYLGYHCVSHPQDGWLEVDEQRNRETETWEILCLMVTSLI